MELMKVFGPLEDFEFVMFKLYRWFSNCLASDQEAVKVFQKMAKEELDHRDVVRSQKTLVMNNYREFRNVDIDLDRIHEISSTLEEFMAKTRKITVEEAVLLAIRIETDASEQHFRLAIMKSNPILQELIERLRNADKIHLERLLTFAKDRSIEIP